MVDAICERMTSECANQIRVSSRLFRGIEGGPNRRRGELVTVASLHQLSAKARETGVLLDSRIEKDGGEKARRGGIVLLPVPGFGDVDDSHVRTRKEHLHSPKPEGSAAVRAARIGHHHN